MALSLSLILFSNPLQARDIEGYGDLLKIYAEGLSEEEQAAFMISIQSEADKALERILRKELPSTLSERQYMLRQSESIPTKIFKFNETYTAVGFEKTLHFKGNWEKAAYMLLFEVQGPHNLVYKNNYLFWKGKSSSLPEYVGISSDYLCKNLSVLSQMPDCGKEPSTTVAKAETVEKTKPVPPEPIAQVEPQTPPKPQTAEKPKTTEVMPKPQKETQNEAMIMQRLAALSAELRQINAAVQEKADRNHTHNGKDITSGIILQNYLDASVARDWEIQNAPGKVIAGDVNDAYVKSLENRIMELENTVRTLSALAEGVSRDQNTLLLSGVNVQIVNGTGSTGDDVNGLGNLIVGYNKPREEADPSERNGSHNIIVGDEHTYTSYGGFVAGLSNSISGAYSTVSGGLRNVASGDYSAVSGGHFKTAEGVYALSQPDASKPPKEEKEEGGCFIGLIKDTFFQFLPGSGQAGK